MSVIYTGKVWSYWKKNHRWQTTGDIKKFSFEIAALRLIRASAETWGVGCSETLPCHETNNIDVEPLTMSYIRKTWLAWHQQIVSARLVSTFHLWLKQWIRMASLRYSVLYTNFKHFHTISYKGNFVRVKIWIA